MISRIRGTLTRRDTESVEILTSGGVGYSVEIPLSVFERLPRAGEEVELHTHQVVREDAITLYGFADERERAIFGRLLGASGVGPRLAIAMLSHLSADALIRAIGERDTAVLRQIPGIGKKTAERLALELADRLDDLVVEVAGGRPEGRAAEEAVGALVALGYSAAEANEAVREALEAEEPVEGPRLIKAALARIGGRS
ncbi:MAG: Holliday junction branch migration protein RuvA [Gemmatimonadota bacterium]